MGIYSASASITLYRMISNKLVKFFSEKRKTDYFNDHKTLVIAVHGFYGHYSNFAPILDLAQDVDLYLWDFHNGKSIEEDVDLLHEELNKFRDKYDHVVLLGLSRGGVIAIRYVIKYQDSIVDKVITIASPLRGTRTASLIPIDCPSKRDLSVSSVSDHSYEGEVDIYHIGIEYDMIVLPISTCFLDSTPENHRYVYSGVYGHHSVLYAREVFDKISEWVGN